VSAAATDARGVPLRSSFVSSVILPRLGASDAAPPTPIRFSACTAAPSARRSQTQPSATAPRATASAHNTQHQRIAGVREHLLTSQLPPTHAAYRGGSATSAAASLRDSVPATLPQLLGCNCLHAPLPHRLAAHKPLHPLQPQAQPPQPATRRIISALPAFATTRS
jgi:hypothetical protein